VEARATQKRAFTPSESSPVPAEHQIRGLHGARMREHKLAATTAFLTEVMGFKLVKVATGPTPSGGWSKHTGYSKGPRQRGMQWTSQNEPGQRAHYVATFDNRSTTEEMYFLAAVWHATKREDCKAGFIKGLNFICAAQFPNGGWPQERSPRARLRRLPRGAHQEGF
jgi:catechol 2,3-dioxygenase-like lactoylglutathione lyase family enzyme